MSPMFLIAEIGVNHDGDVDRAASMIEAAATAGFDAVKFQYWIVDELLSADVPSAPYQGAQDQHALLEQLRLDIDELRALADVAADVNVEFIVTPDGERACHDVSALRPPRLKIGSGDADNPWLLRAAADTGLPLLVSTGTMLETEVKRTAERLADVIDVTFLHCVTAYPTPIRHAGLMRINSLSTWTGRPVGLSDHTIGTASAAASVALGVRTIEKHITWSLTAEGPDHAASLPLDDARAWVDAITSVETDLDDPTPEPEEMVNRRVVRKAIFASRDLAEGTLLEDHDLVPLRPLSDGIPAGEVDSLIGRRLARDVPAGELVTRDAVR